MKLLELASFSDWLQGLPLKLRLQVDARLHRIEEHQHFGDAKDLGGGLAELKWRSGLRVYFARVELDDGESVLLILGGNKNGQDRDITKARLLLRKHAEGEVEVKARRSHLRSV